MTKLVSVFIMLVACTMVTTSAAAPQSVKKYTAITTIECKQSSDCEAGSCCVLGMMAYSIPSCIPMRSLGDSCRPNNQPYDTTVSYPDGSNFNLFVYSSLCPCAAGLSCENTDGLTTPELRCTLAMKSP